MIIFRYIFKKVIGSFLYLTAVFTVILYLIQSFRFFKYIIQRQINIEEFFSFTFLLFPHVLSYLIPFTFAISVVYVYQNLDNRKELLVLKSLGFSKNFLIRPAAFTALTALALQIGLHYLSPYSFQEFLAKEKDFMSRVNFRILKPHQFNMLNRYVIYFSDHEATTVQNVFLYYENPEHQLFITAHSGELQDRPDNLKTLYLKHGTQIEYNRKTHDINQLSFEDFHVNLEDWKKKSINIRDILLGKHFRQLLIESDDLARGEAYIRIAKTLLPLIVVFFLSILMFNLNLKRKYVIAGIFSCSFAFALLLITRVMTQTPFAILIYIMCILCALAGLSLLKKTVTP